MNAPNCCDYAAVDVDHLTHYAEYNERLHTLMLEAADSPIVARALNRVASLPFASPNASVLVQAKIPGSFEILKIAQYQHHDIVEAIETRAGVRAEALVREHSRIARKNLELALRNAYTLGQMAGALLIRRHSG
jgi:GntR family transcriptional regulator of vanillate catabolism